jgi:D-alanyl-D-alanine carboxypeptidase (penicillin-binding protein 5/6)
MMSYRFGIVVSVACMAFLLALQGSLSKERWTAYTTPPAVAVAQVPVAPLLQLKPGKETIRPQLTAQAALLIDQQSGSVLFEHNADAPLPPASTTKLMTALVAREVYAPGTLLRVPPLSSIGGTKVGLTPGLQYSVENILEAALISSGNDAAHTLATNLPGGVDAFVAQMNQKAQEINLSTAAFINPTGFDAVQLRMSARDLSILTREVLKDTLLKAIVATPQTVISDISGTRKSILRTTNHLLGVDPRVVGVKTGTTEEAGQVLVSAFEIDGHVLISIVMGSADRYAETRSLVDWALDAYEWVEFDQTMVY